MKKCHFLLFILSLFLNLGQAQTVNDFALLNVDGKSVSLSQFPEAKGFIVVFTCNHCPFAQLYQQRLNDLQQKFKPLGVPLLAINAIDSAVYEDEGFVNMVAKAETEHFQFPYLLDENQSVAKNFGADRTPHAFVIWKEACGDWAVKYSGAIDDNGVDADSAQKPYLKLAVETLLRGQKVAIPMTNSIGCKIYFR